MKIIISVLSLSLLPAIAHATLGGQETTSGSGGSRANRAAKLSAETCTLTPDSTFKATNSKGDLEVIPIKTAMQRPDCRQVRDMTKIFAAYGFQPPKSGRKTLTAINFEVLQPSGDYCYKFPTPEGGIYFISKYHEGLHAGSDDCNRAAEPFAPKK